MSFFTNFTTLKKSLCGVFLMSSMIASAQIDTHEVGDMGYLRSPMETANGLIVTNSRYSEIYTLKDNVLSPILNAPNCGLYTNLSKDGKYLGFKSFNANDEQAPAILDVTTGVVTILEDYIHQCGQVSFANDGTMAYTMGSSLIIRKGNMRQAFDLGFYTNIANISPDATKVAYSHIDGRMFVIDITTGAKENVAIEGGYRAIWSPDGQKMIVHISNGTLAVEDRTTKRIYNLGEGESASWANNSNELIFTKIERKNEFEVTGSTIKKVNFDGSNEIVLVSSSDNLPTDAILTSDNKLITSYKTGAKRGLAVKDLVSGITPLAASINDKSIISFDAEEIVGSRLPNPCDNPNIKPSVTTAAFQQKIGALDIPYLSQIYDSPSINGCTSYGYVTCAPTSACMYLGYYGLLNKKATTNRYDGTTKYYAYAIGQQYTNQAGTYTFNLGSYKNCATIYGGYGYMWNSSSPRSTFIDFMTLNGCTSAAMQWSSSTSWTKFQSESTAGRPTLLCIALESSGHLILGFATNCKYRSATGFTEQTGSFVCHDPYGDDNDSSWADNDGQHSTYDWVGYNNSQANIGTFYYSCTAVPPTSAVEPVETGVKCDPESIELSGEVGSTDVIYKDVKVTGSNLSSAIAVASATSAITATKLDGWNDLTGGTLRLTLNTNFVSGAGTYESYVAVQSTSTYRVEIKTKVTLTDPAGSTTTPTIAVNPTSASMNAKVGESATQAITVTGTDLTGNISATLSGDAAFSIDNTSLGTSGGTITVTYKPTAAGTQTATLTLASTGATSKTVSISGTATAAGSSEPTPSVSVGLTKVWKNTSGIPGTPAGTDVRFAAVSNGKLIANDKANSKIIEITATGTSDFYDVSAAITTNYSQALGTAIGCDDAGNILVNAAFSGATSGSSFTLISADLKSTYKIDLSTIEGYTASRVDQIGRIRGNMLSSEGGYAFICPNSGTAALVVKIVNGAIDANYSQLTNNIGSNFGTLSTSCVAQPAFETVAEIDALMDDNGDLSNAFIMRNRSYPTQVLGWNSDNSALVDICKFSNTTAEGYTTSNASQEGFDWFTLKDKAYYIMPLTTDGTTNGRSSAWAIFDQEGEIVAYHAEDLKTGVGQGIGSFIAVPNGDGVSVSIYHFLAGTVAEKFIFAVESSAVESIEIENADAPAEYYNLQGVKVANPANGIFIKVQNGKATKEYVK